MVVISAPPFYRPTWVEISLPALEQNFQNIQRLLKSETTLMAVIKADGYGHGAVPLARYLSERGVGFFGVSSLEEGIQLREAGINTPILVLGSIYPFSNFRYLVEYRLTPLLASIAAVNGLDRYVGDLDSPYPVHLKVDTGMGRIGVRPESFPHLLTTVQAKRQLLLEGVCTHLASADSDPEFTRLQLTEFNQVITSAATQGVRFRYRHCANSAAFLRYPESHLDLVRLGLLFYGLSPYPDSNKDFALEPVLSWKTRVVFLKEIAKGKPLSYGGTFHTSRFSRIATLPVGYADGFNRLLSNQTWVLVRGKRVPVVGRVTMDMVLVDVTDLADVAVGDEVVLVGKQGTETISVEEIAQKVNSINYEVVCDIGKRVPRIYQQNEKSVGKP